MTLQPPPRSRDTMPRLPLTLTTDELAHIADKELHTQPSPPLTSSCSAHTPNSEYEEKDIDIRYESDEKDARDKGEDVAASPISALARIAYASGTGEDVAVLAEEKHGFRWKLDDGPLRVLALILALLLLGTWGYMGINSASSSSSADNTTKTVPADIHENEGEENDSIGISSPPPASSQSSVIYISGAVANPGVYTLPAGKRLNDLVDLAGGLTDNAQRESINLAATVNDGEHVHIPAIGEEVPVATTETNGAEAAHTDNGKININTAQSAELEQLPGIGPALAKSIIEWRTDNGPFTQPEDLLDVSGIGEAKYGKLKDKISV